jgi:hypothetical protein
MSLSLLPIKAANMLIIDTSDQMASQWTYLQEHKPLMLRNAHFKIVPVTVSISLLPVKAAHTLFMENSEQISFQLTYLPQQISLPLH